MSENLARLKYSSRRDDVSVDSHDTSRRDDGVGRKRGALKCSSRRDDVSVEKRGE